MKDIKAFLRSKECDIGLGDENVNSLLASKSMRCIEIAWVILQFLSIRYSEKILDLGISFFDKKYFKLFFESVILPSNEFHGIDIIPFNPKRFYAMWRQSY